MRRQTQYIEKNDDDDEHATPTIRQIRLRREPCRRIDVGPSQRRSMRMLANYLPLKQDKTEESQSTRGMDEYYL